MLDALDTIGALGADPCLRLSIINDDEGKLSDHVFTNRA